MKALAALLAVCFVTGVALTTLEGGVTLLVGWVPFLGRVLPQISVNWPSVAVGLVALALFAAGVHAVGSTGGSKRAGEHPAAPRWRFRWTVSIVALVILLFAAGISVIGAVHQVTWLARSDRYAQTVGGGSRQGDINLRMIGMGIGGYRDTHRGQLPSSATAADAADGLMLHGWETQILPYMVYSTQEIDLKKPWNDPVNQRYFKCIIPDLINPDFRAPELEDGDGYGLTHYSANSHVLAAGKRMKLEDIKDGTANTLLIGEVNADFRPWGRPNNVRDPTAGINSPRGFGGAPGRGGARFAMVDGSVRFVSDNISPDVLRALSTPNGGEKVDSEQVGQR
jgi:hypothetical protein